MTEEPLQTQSASAPPDDVSRLSLVSEFINNEMAAEENLKLADPFTPNFGDAVSGETGGGGGGGGGGRPGQQDCHRAGAVRHLQALDRV